VITNSSVRTSLLVGLLAASLGACSGAAAAPSVPSVPDASRSPGASPSASPGAGANASQDPQDAMLAYAKCMRDNGVDFPDPQPISGSGGSPQLVPIDIGSPVFEKAEKACASKLPAFGQSDPAANQQFQDQMLAYAKCMRDHGIDFPDPKFDSSGGGSAVQIGGNVDPNAPAFQEAQKACGSNLPGGSTMITVGGDSGGAPVTKP